MKILKGKECVLDNDELFQIGEKALIVTKHIDLNSFEDVSFNLTMSDIGYELYDFKTDTNDYYKNNECDYLICIGNIELLKKNLINTKTIFINTEFDENTNYDDINVEYVFEDDRYKENAL